MSIAFPNLGLYFHNLPKAIEIFGFSIAFYGIIIATGFFLGYNLSIYQAKRLGFNSDYIVDFAPYVMIASIICARLYFVIFSFDYYKDNLLEIFNIRAGGLAIYGGIIGGVLCAIWYCKKNKINLLDLLDSLVAGLLVGQSLGRFGNFFNREAFGDYTDTFFRMLININETNLSNVTPKMLENIEIIDGIKYISVHPTFLYESFWNLCTLIIILLITKKRQYKGQLVLIYMLSYGLARFLIEGLRTDQLRIFGTIAVSQVLSLILFIISLVILLGKKYGWSFNIRKKRL